MYSELAADNVTVFLMAIAETAQIPPREMGGNEAAVTDTTNTD